MHLADLVPDEEVLLALEPEELGLLVLQVLVQWSPHIDKQVGPFINGALSGYPSAQQRDQITLAIREAWAWLEGQGLLLLDPRYLAGDIRILSRRARRLASNAKARRPISGQKLPKGPLHPTIREDVWSLYHRGKYDTAVFEAMKAVEVAVRDAGQFGPRDLGRDTIRNRWFASKIISAASSGSSNKTRRCE